MSDEEFSGGSDENSDRDGDGVDEDDSLWASKKVFYYTLLGFHHRTFYFWFYFFYFSLTSKWQREDEAGLFSLQEGTQGV